MQSVSEFELESLGIRRKPRPWGWFFAGLIALAGAGFALAYYLPLYQAHATLVAQHDKLGRKAKELDHALVTTQAKLETTERQRAALQAPKDKAEEAAKTVSQRLAVTAATVSNSLASMVKYRQLSVAATPSRLTLSFGKKWVYLPASGKVSASGQRLLCKTMLLLSQASGARVTAAVSVAPDAPLKAWSEAGEQAASVAAVLREGCGAAPSSLRAEVVTGDAKNADQMQLVVTIEA